MFLDHSWYRISPGCPHRGGEIGSQGRVVGHGQEEDQYLFHLLHHHGVLAPRARAHLLFLYLWTLFSSVTSKVNGMALMMDESKTYGLGNELILEKLRGVPAEE